MTEVFGLSSIQILASPSFPIPRLMRDQSSEFNCPLRMLVASTRASEQRIRWVNSIWLISSENTTVGSSHRIPMWVAKPRPKEVFPMAGRDPTMMSDSSWRPDNSMSRSS